MATRSATETHDLCQLQELTDGEISKCLQERYRKGIYYTYIGDAVVAVNPCKEVPIYGHEYHKRYKNAPTKSSDDPHIFWTAGEALSNIRARHESSCIIVGGISGAGKTESTKFMLEHILLGEGSDGTNLAEKLKMSSPVLEMFGNAKTILNDNSSRFAKLMTLGYTADGMLVGADIKCYTLEKSRVIYQQSGERNFHILYQMMASLSPKELSEYHINVTEEYRILGHWQSAEQKDIRRFTEFRRALNNIDIKGQILSDMYQVLAAILLLTNIRFRENTDGHAVITQEDENRYIRPVCDMLGISEGRLQHELMFRTILTPKDRDGISSPKSVYAADDERDALAKYMYSRLFEGIVTMLNTTMTNLHPDMSISLHLGILDISGFENLPAKNSFEQLLINITNEAMHEIFVEHVCRREQQMYREEGIDWQNVQFDDNSEVLDLLIGIHQHQLNVLSLLEDMNQGSLDDRQFNNHLHKYCSGNLVFVERQVPMEFGIKHYAGQVCYSTRGFVDKNANTLPKALKACLQCSTNTFLSSQTNGNTVSKLHGYVSTDFKKSLGELKHTLQEMKPLFVRCVTPNKSTRPGLIDGQFIDEQLRSGGVMDVTRIRKYGYPKRYSVSEFVDRYGELTEGGYGLSNRDITHMILGHDALKSGMYQIGYSKVFLKEHASDILDNKLRQKKEREEKERRQQKEFLSVNTMKDGGRFSCNTSAYSSMTASPLPSDQQSKPDVCETTETGDKLSHIDEDLESTSDTEYDMPDGKEEDRDKSLIKAYDMFRETEEDIDDESDECTKRFLKSCRLIFYLLLFLLTTGAGVIVHVCFIALITRFKQTTGTEKSKQAYKLLLCAGLPQSITLMMSFISVIMGRIKSLPIKLLIPVLLVECLQSLGISVLMYKVLPDLDSLRSSVIMLAVAIVPSLLSFTEMLSQRSKKCSLRCIMSFLSCVIFLIQSGGVLVLLLVDLEKTLVTDIALTVGSLVLISLGWWENFLHGKILGIDLSQYGRQLQKSRHKVNVWTSFMKIGTLLLCTYFLVDNHQLVFSGKGSDQSVQVITNTTDILTTTTDPCIYSNGTEIVNCTSAINLTRTQTAGNTPEEFISFLEDNSLILIMVLASVVFYVSSLHACYLYMQRFAFCAPLSLFITPLSLGFLYMKCIKVPIIHDVFTYDLMCPSTNLSDLAIPLAVAAALWLSLILLTWYIWIPNHERMASPASIFVLPAFDCIMPHTNLMLRRKCDERKFRRSANAGKVAPEEVRKETGIADAKDDAQNTVPKVFICATMWHETRQEMTQLLKSLFRIDLNCAAREFLSRKYKRKDPDQYEPEVHIIVDDAFKESKKTKQRVPNGYIMQLIDCVQDTSRLFISEDITWSPLPKKATLPYGGRLTWVLPGGTKMIVHMKDKTKIRHRKRWSQIMYMYYLLGYKVFGNQSEQDVTRDSKSNNRRRMNRDASIFRKLPDHLRDELKNTFILTLDGDVDFQPGSVRLLIDRMKKNSKVGAVCGRIHPIGSGPMVWYQRFEYAVGHWLQKAAEHVLGCVLCCPGCFSLFRANAIMDDNVLRTYTTPPTEAKHHIQFEQGEDRWLCTLLLQQGYKIDYCAGADALTHAPETFNEFFIQRRRWSPSTMANIMDLLSSWKTTVRRNDNLSSLYMLYQSVMIVTSVLSPATVALLIAGAYASVLGLDTVKSYYLSIAPILIYIIVCFKCSPETQLKIAAFLSSVYSVVMVIVTIGTILNIIEDDFLSPNVLFLVGLAAIFIVTAICHPNEFGCLLHGLLYYLTVPSTFIFLTVYFIVNINNVSWGTREKAKATNSSGASLLKRTGNQLYEHLIKIVEKITGIELSSDPLEEDTVTDSSKALNSETGNANSIVNDRFWMDFKYFSKLDELTGIYHDEVEKEEEFWQEIMKKYLMPLDRNVKQELAMKEELNTLRYNVVFGFFLLNFMFSIALFQLQLNRERLTSFFLFGKYEPVSVLFLAIFLLILSTQFIAMLIHRWGTFLHLLASTHLSQRETEDFNYDLNHTNSLIRPHDHHQSSAETSEVGELEPDYDVSDVEENHDNTPEPDYDNVQHSRYPRPQHRNAYQDVFAKNFHTRRRHPVSHSHNMYRYRHYLHQHHRNRPRNMNPYMI